MTPKYSTSDDSDSTVYREDTRHILRRWADKPFHGVSHRHEAVEQRIVIEYHHGVGVDILHEARSDDTPKFGDDWSVVQRFEVRDTGMRYDRRPEARWLEP